MSSSTSSFKGLAAGVLMAAAALGALEVYWRGTGAEASVNPSSDMALWAFHHEKLLGDRDALAILGTSRALFDFDLPTLRRETGFTNIQQLAVAGSHPLASLEAFAADARFHGRIIIELTEEALASAQWESQRAYVDPRGAHFTLPERLGAPLRARIEERVVFLSPFLSTLHILDMKSGDWPDVRERWNADRSSTCVAGHPMPMEWNLHFANIGLAAAREELAVSLEAKLARLEGIVERLRRRHIQVIFVRAPVAPQMASLYDRYLPRREYWDRMVAAIDAPFLRADDHHELARFSPPDGSHLCGADPAEFTRSLSIIMHSLDLLPAAGAR